MTQPAVVLVTGFGPFPGVTDNPTARIARAVDGARIGPVQVVGRVLDVSFRRGPDTTIALARDLGAALVVGLGVATGRSVVKVERVAVRAPASGPDVDGSRDSLLDGAPQVFATVDVQRFAAALGAGVSDDAGHYVCNAWLYRVAAALTVPVGFVHVPRSGLSPERLLAALGVLVSPQVG